LVLILLRMLPNRVNVPVHSLLGELKAWEKPPEILGELEQWLSETEMRDEGVIYPVR
jgi:hypothetical protein